jgi:ABC-2 type transport system permease protein
MGFDAINSERNRGTLSRLLAQPIYRDYVINAKFVAALLLISVLLFALGFLVMGLGLIAIGIPPTPEEFGRMLCFLILSVLYISFWLNMSILCSVRFRQAATSALSGIAVWIFFSVFYGLLVNLIAGATAPSQAAGAESVISHQQFVQALSRLSPSQLFSEATVTMLTPSVRSLGPLTMEQIYGAIPSPLPFGQSLLLVWPQVVGLIAATMVCFAASYVLFMRQEIRSR